MKAFWFGFFLVFVLVLVPPTTLSAQTRSAFFDQPAQIIPPEGYSSRNLYPAIIFLPYTTGTSQDQARAFGIVPGGQQEFFVILPAGRFQSHDYLPNFIQFVEWYEQRLLNDLNTALASYSIDPNRLYLAGYSLGGDLGWALTARNPDLFAGAVMAGTRASYPMTEGSREVLGMTGYRGYFLIGDREHPDRENGIRLAFSQLNSGGVRALLQTYPGGHEVPPQGHLTAGLEFITQAQRTAWTPTSQGRQGTTGSVVSPASPSAAIRPGSSIPWGSMARGVFLRHPSMYFGLRYVPNFDIGAEGFSSPAVHQGQFRAEGLFDDIYLRGLTTLGSLPLSTEYSMNSLTQEIALAYGGRSMWGLGFGWDWTRWFKAAEDNGEISSPEDAPLRRFTASAFWIHPRRMQGVPASVLELKYQIPQTLSPFIAAHVFNGELRYRIHVTDRILLTAGLGSTTVQNAPVGDSSDLSEALDHELYWSAGFGFRAPGPFRWSVNHTGSRVAPVGGEGSGYRGSWSFALEYMF